MPALACIDRYSEKEFAAGASACKFWRFALLIKPFCGWPGIILETLSNIYLVRARKTLRTPFLVWLMILTGPGWSFLSMLPGSSMSLFGRVGVSTAMGMLFVVYVILMVTQTMTSFFVRNAIFHQWTSLYTDDDLAHCLRYWERAFLFLHFPAITVYLWIAILWLSEGWQIEDFQGLELSRIAAGDITVACVPFVLTFLGWLVGLIYEYKVLSRFETRLFAVAARQRKHRDTALEAQAQQATA